MSPLFTSTTLSPVFKVMSMSVSVSLSVPIPVPMSMSSSLACPQELVFLALGWTLQTHSNSVSALAHAHLQSYWAKIFQACPIILRPGQGVQGPVGEQPSSTFGNTGPLATMPSMVSVITLALWTSQRVL